MAVRWTPARPGNWLFHCHFAFHISDDQLLSAPPDKADGTGGQPHHHMAGLVLGIHVTPASAPSVRLAVATEPAEPRSLRLLVQPAPHRRPLAHIMGYALQEGGLEPAGDSAPIPGSTLVLERGRPVRITVVNRLAEPTAVHWHGIELESYPDGVPGWSGTGAGCSGHRAGRLVRGRVHTAPGGNVYLPLARERDGPDPGGLYGPLIVVEPGTTYDTASNRARGGRRGLFRNDSSFGVVNGRLEPAPIEILAGRSYRFRLINIGDARRGSLSGVRSDSSLVTWRAVAKDGADLPPSQAVAAGGCSRDRGRRRISRCGWMCRGSCGWRWIRRSRGGGWRCRWWCADAARGRVLAPLLAMRAGGRPAPFHPPSAGTRLRGVPGSGDAAPTTAGLQMR